MIIYKKYFKGIYKITHISGRYYIGQSNHIARRLSQHLTDILLGLHSCGPSTALDEYTFAILFDCSKMKDKDRLALEKKTIKEAVILDKDNCTNKMYNKKTSSSVIQ